MKRLTLKDENGYYLTGDGIYSDCGVPEKFRGEDIDLIAAIEGILGDEYELDRLREIVEADREGRVRIIAGPKAKEAVCGNCGNFVRIPGTRTGVCRAQSFYRNQYGKEEPRRGTFSPSQSRKACRKFVRAEAALKAREQDG